nr:MAG TPA: hypothetical protein [Caudoviricetes sp.]
MDIQGSRFSQSFYDYPNRFAKPSRLIRLGHRVMIVFEISDLFLQVIPLKLIISHNQFLK